MPNLRVVYEPKGRAREYAALALNPWNGCPHRCVYCYCHSRPGSRYPCADAMAAATAPREGGFLKRLERDAEQLAGDGRRVLLQFMGDPYPYQEAETKFTRQVLEILAKHNIRWDILTKGGMLATRDFDLYGPGCRFGQTFCFWDEGLRKLHEPGARPLEERIMAFTVAKDHGIETFCSVEPAWIIGEVLLVLHHLRRLVDTFNIGRLNEHPLGDGVDWAKFGALLGGYLREQPGLRYYLKRTLRPHMPEGTTWDTRAAETAKGADHADA
jgi:DNA repair photolyase